MGMSASKFKVAAVQMVSGNFVQNNLEAVGRLVHEAAEQGAELVVLPENFALMSTSKLYEAGIAERQPEGPIRDFTAQLASRLKVCIVAGSIPVSSRPDGTSLESRVRAACFVYGPDGSELARYDKLHLFDVDVADQYSRYRESETIEPGDQPVVATAPNVKLGLSICYDLRFPELYRLLLQDNAEVLTVPAAFTATTGAAHWEVLLRARAIENQCYVIGAGQGGQHSESRETWGHSMIVDPWGKVLASGTSGEQVIVVEIDLEYLADVRRRMPIAQHRRFS